MWVVSKALWPGGGSTPALRRLRRRIRQLNNFCWRSLVLREDSVKPEQQACYVLLFLSQSEEVVQKNREF